MNYASIRIEGAILSPDILERLDDAVGQQPADFGLESSAKVKDEIARAWADAQDYWRIFQRKLDSLKAESPATTETRNNWIVPLLGLLGYQLEYQARGTELNDKNYPISHRVTNRGQTPVHIIGCREPSGLDRKPEKSALRMSAHAMVQEYLNLTDQLFGVVTNGRVLRLMRDSSRLIKLSYLEFDLDRIFADGLFADFAMLYRLLHATRLPQSAEVASSCWLERYHQDTIEQGTRIRDGLRAAVTEALELLGTGFISDPHNDALRQQIESKQLAPEDFFKHILRLVYRLLFLMVTEERGLVFPKGTPAKHINIYFQHYSVQRLRRLALTRGLKIERCHDAWLSLLSTFRLFEDPDTATKLSMTALVGQLFHPESLGLLSGCRLSNAALFGALDRLCNFNHPKGGQRMPVNFGALATEEFGSVYESLLELHPIVETQPIPLFRFKQAAGNERKTTGSYYTPSSLVDCLLDSALDPVLDERIREFVKLGYKSAEAAILALKVCDPACGSGHFLIAAAQRLARRLARVRSGDDEPSPQVMRHALRDVIGHCIYGVDINPMSVELCKVALWMEAMEPGKPLSFLDHHIQCGNSLLGTTPALLTKGIPDNAFTAIEGDVKVRVAGLKKENKKERNEYEQGQGYLFKPHFKLGNLAADFARLNTAPDGTLAEVAALQEQYARLVISSEYESTRLLADTWCAAFVWKKDDSELGKLCPTERDFRKVESHAAAGLLPHVREEVELLRDKYQFFHWHLAFPDVFRLPGKDETPENEQTGWSGGFDVVLGNPPWVRQEMLKPIKQLLPKFTSYASTADSSVYFIELSVLTCRVLGRVAMLTPNKWFRANYAENLRKVLRQRCRTELLVDFGHSRNLFPDADTFPAAVVFQSVGSPVADSEVARFVQAHDSDRERHALPALIRAHAVAVPHHNLRPARWQLEDSSASCLLDRLVATGFPLDSVLCTPIIRGILSGLNEAFYVETSQRDAMVAFSPGSEALFKKLLRGRDVKRWVEIWDDQWHIVIPSSHNRPWQWASAADEAEAEAIFAELHPSVHSHLKKFEQPLRARQDKGKYWWELRACDYYEAFEKPKILVQCIAYYSQFAFDTQSHYVNNKVIVIPTDDLYMLAILNSRVTWWIVNRTFQHMKDEGLSVDVQFLRCLPVPSVSDGLRAQISKVAHDLTTAAAAESGGNEIAALEVRLNELVMQAFAMTDAERTILDATLPPRDPIATARSLADNSELPADWPAHVHAPPGMTVGKPKPTIVIDPAFPASTRERVLCATLLDLVAADPSRTDADYVDVLSILLSPTIGEKLLHGADLSSLKSCVKKAPSELVKADDPPHWYQFREALLAMKALATDANGLAPGSNFTEVRNGLPSIDAKLIALATKAAASYRELRDIASDRQHEAVSIGQKLKAVVVMNS